MHDTTHVYRGPSIPEPIGEQLRRALGLDERPRVFADWIDALARLADRDGFELSMDALCTTDHSPHLARFDGTTTYYRCVQDPIVVPFLAEGINTVKIQTHSPVDETPIELVVRTTGIESTPEEAVFSFGVDAEVDGPPPGGVSPAFAYGVFCPYGHAFGSLEEYDTWAQTVDALTMPVGMEDTLAWARALAGVAR